MKKYIVILILSGLSLVLATSCLKEYLDKAPESGLTPVEVFAKYENYLNFFNTVYDGRKYYSGNWRDYSIKNGFPYYFDMWDQKYTWEGITDAADGGRYMEGHTLKAGQVQGFVNKFIYDGNRRPILESMFTCIRICNKSLENIYLLEQNYTDTIEINDLKAQAHFVRAFCHFELFRIWGPMPYITKTLDLGDQFDLPRLSKHETLIKIAQDFDTAAMYFNRAGRMRRDGPPGAADHLKHSLQARPTGVAAKAYRARALLYAASPLNNELGVVDWQTAAVANWEALKLAETDYKYALLTIANRKSLYYGSTYTNETLWGYTWNSQSWNWGNFQGTVNGIFGASVSSWSSANPTQNWVDKYETKDGMPLNTDADRTAAITAGKFKEQDPYTNRDPRLDIDVIVNQGACQGWTNGKAQIYYEIKPNGSVSFSELLDHNYLSYTRTGYYERKRWANQSQKAKNSAIISTPLMRLTELYLNYAEASNEAYGPTTIGVPGATMTALQAINAIRTRAGQVAVLPAYTGSTAAFRPRIRNERNVELSYEGHYYFDERRWMDAPVAYSSTLIGMDIEKVPVTTTYTKGFRYTRLPLSNDRQSRWKDAMYYLPFNVEDTYKMKNFTPNTPW
jgi:hypothetical protein